MHRIESKRIILREWQQSDFAPFARINSSKNVCEFLPKTLSEEESKQFAQRIIQRFTIQGFGLFALEDKKTSKFIGYAGFNVPKFEARFMPCIEIGWRLSYDFWGKGYATEAALAVRNHGFEQLGFLEIVSFTVANNLRSISVMKKIGMVHKEEDDFYHPNFKRNNPLCKHVLYRLNKKAL